MNNPTPTPQELRVADNGTRFIVSFGPGQVYELSAELLRVESPSAEVQGHSAAEKRTIGGKKDVRITDVEPVGNYAVRLVFDDGHDTGLYTWDYFERTGLEQDGIWADYLSRLEEFGLSREGQA